MGQLCLRNSNEEYDIYYGEERSNELIDLNSKMIVKIRSSQCKYRTELLKFHEVIVYCKVKVLDELFIQVPSQLEDLQLDDFTLNSIQHLSKSGLYTMIQEQIMSRPQSIFNTLVNHYFKYLQQLFGLKSLNNSKKTTTSLTKNLSSDKCDKSVSLAERDDISHIVEQTCYRAADLLQILVQQMDFIFKACRWLVQKSYRQQIIAYFGGDADQFPDREIFVQRLIQHRLLAKTDPLRMLNPYIIEMYYLAFDNSVMQLSVVPEKGTVISIGSHLIPANNVQVNITSDSFLQGESTLKSALTEDQIQNREKVQEVINRSAQRLQTVHYSQTFPILTELIKTQKPWKKFLLIEKLQRVIEKLFIQEEEGPSEQRQEIIQAEDSKSEILIYILHEYKLQHNIDYEDQHNQLRLMDDFDGILHSDVKYIFCPSFIRFKTMLQIYLSYPQ